VAGVWARQSDPYWSSVVLLLKCDGTDASTTFTDVSNAAHTITANGNAQVDTAQSKFGGASLLLDGTGDYLSAASSTDWAFGTGDFTVEFFFRKTANGPSGFDNAMSTADNAGTGAGGWFIELSTSRGLNVNFAAVQVLTAADSGWGTDGAWHHFALCRAGTALSAYIDGTSVDGDTNSTDLAQTALRIGDEAGFEFAGHIDEIRITKGVARYTANFTAPTTEFIVG
jgi:hypothetical protein